MPVPSSFSDLDTTATNNSPPGTESAKGNIDNYLRAAFAFIKQLYNAQQPSISLLGSVSGTDTITAAATPAIGSYSAGQCFRFVSAGANTTNAVTLNINGLGAKAITKNGATALAAGDIPSGVVCEVVYDGTRFQLLNVSAPSLSGYAPLDSPTFTGTPSAPTAAAATNTTQIATTAFVQSAVGSIATTPPGSIVYVAQNSAPAGYLKANGAEVSRTTYSALFAAIGTTFGAGNGTTTFTLPDMRGEFLRGFDDGRGVDSGRALGSFQAQDIQSHAHSISGAQDLGGTSFVSIGSTTAAGSVATGNAGGTETRPRNIAMLACIKY